jgi:hypothetical protein
MDHCAPRIIAECDAHKFFFACTRTRSGPFPGDPDRKAPRRPTLSGGTPEPFLDKLRKSLNQISEPENLKNPGTSVEVTLLPWLKSLERFRDLSSCSDCYASISGDLFVAASFYSVLVCVAAESSYFGQQMFKWASELQVPGGSHHLDPSEIQS